VFPSQIFFLLSFLQLCTVEDSLYARCDQFNLPSIFFIVYWIFLSSLTLCITTYFFISYTIGTTDLHPFPAPHFKTFQAFLLCFLKCPNLRIIKSYTPNYSTLGGGKLWHQSGHHAVRNILPLCVCVCVCVSFLCKCCVIYMSVTMLVKAFRLFFFLFFGLKKTRIMAISARHDFVLTTGINLVPPSLNPWQFKSQYMCYTQGSFMSKAVHRSPFHRQLTWHEQPSQINLH
jgi:hypothetical protein